MNNIDNIDFFDKKIDEIKLCLEELKKDFSLDQKLIKTDDAKDKINKVKQDINKRLDKLRGLGDVGSLEKSKKLEEKLFALDNFFSEILF